MTAPQRPEHDFLERRAGVLPPALVPVFNERFVESGILYEEYTYRLALEVFRETGLAPHLRDPASTEELVARAALDPLKATVPLDWILRMLAARGAVEMISAPGGAMRFRAHSPLPELDPEEPRRAQRDLDPSWMVSYEIARTSARGYPGFLNGKATGEEVLFAPEPLSLWFEYFSNRNGLYVVNNIVGAYAAEEWLPAGGGLQILELGGGLGSAALALLERLEKSSRLADVARYHFTELQPGFLRRGQRALTDRFGNAPFLSPARLDMNRAFAEQGIAENSLSLVYAVNTLHVARDLGFTLEEIRRALAPGGAVVLSECIRPLPGMAVYAEFVFNLMEAFRAPMLDPRFRPNGGFLTPEQWAAALEASGLTDVRFVPDIPEIRKKYAFFFVAAIGATRPA